MRPIPDSIQSNVNILFVGFNPSIRSGETGHHYANPNNRFYRILYQAGITPRLYRPEEDTTMIELGYGFTNIVARPTKEAAEITKEEYEQGRKELRSKIEKFKPQAVCFVGKGVYEQYSQRKQINWGIQDQPVVEGVVEFVAPSSSGLVRMPMSEVVEIYRGLLPIIGRK